MISEQEVDLLSQRAGRRIRIIRKQKKIRQRNLAKASGIAAPHLCYIERGSRGVSLSVLGRIAKSLGVQAYELIQ